MSQIGKPRGAYKKPMPSKQYLYNQILITKTVTLNIMNIGNNIKETLEKAISNQIEGKCIVEGYVQPNTTEIITFSSGLIHGNMILFEVVFKCNVCSPVEGMNIVCIAKNINKMGIRAETRDNPSPIVIFISRDHNYNSPLFSQVQLNDEIKVRVIGQRYELNDKYISIIAELIDIQTEAAPASAMGTTAKYYPAPVAAFNAPKPYVPAASASTTFALAEPPPQVKIKKTIMVKKTPKV
jgi:DNA-directed RNA polymerase subunit E'/Rpb7